MNSYSHQEIANTAWTFAMVKCRDDKLVEALVTAAERWLLEFNAQGVANTAWAFATKENKSFEMRSYPQSAANEA